MEFQSKADILTAALREMIITGEIEAGSPLKQRDVASRFGVSPTPVREALRRLESEGIVRHDLHRGVTALPPATTSQEDAFQIRASLESLAARMAAMRATEDDLDKMRGLHAEYAASRVGDDSLFEQNRAFHFQVYESANSPTLLALLKLLWQRLHDIPEIAKPSRNYADEHAAILNAIINRDPDEAERLTRDHILAQVVEIGSAALVQKVS